jgi:polyhydroxyalkanoate synthase
MVNRPNPRRQPTPLERRGPRPLALHLASAGAAWTSLRAALPLIVGGSFPWPAPLAQAAADLQRDLAAASAEPSAGADVLAAVDRVAEQRLLEFTAGVSAYRAHPYRRSLREPPVLWRDGTTRLLDYGVKQAGRPLLVVPSLVNRAHVLDLTAETSLLRHLAARGHRPLLVDWGAPGETERAFDLTDYIHGRLSGALDAATAAAGAPVPVVGYCMGGNLALALAQLRAERVSALALLATPWDFQRDGPIRAPLDAASAASLHAAFAALAEFPVDLLQAMFASLDPFLVARKYRAFAKAQASAGAAAKDDGALFVALEDWVNDGVPLAAKVAAECLVGWYGQNAPALGAWRVAGQAITPARWQKPALLLMPQQDKIVPPSSSAALAAAMPQAVALKVASGHVAMIVGRQAKAQSWAPLAEWLDDLAPRQPATKARAQKSFAKKLSINKTPATTPIAGDAPAKKTAAKKTAVKKIAAKKPKKKAVAKKDRAKKRRS